MHLQTAMYCRLWLQHVPYKWHVRFHTHLVLHSCLANQSQAALKGFYWGGQGQEQGLQCMMRVICHGKQMRFWCPCDPGVWGSHGSMGLSPFWTHSSCCHCVGGKSGGNLCTGKCEFQSNSICLLLLPLSSLSSAEQHKMWVLWLPVENSVIWCLCVYIGLGLGHHVTVSLNACFYSSVSLKA